MIAKARLAMIFPILVVSGLLLQGCPVSDDGPDEEAAAPVTTPRVALATTTGTTFLIANGTSSVPIQLTVTNAAGQGMAGLPVTFTTTAGSFAAAAPAVALRADSSTITTDANGTAQVILTSSTTVETATVSAMVDTGGGTSIAPTPLTINFISNIPAQITLQAIPSTVGIGTTSTLIATVTTNDTPPLPVAGVTVTFDFQANNSNGFLSASSGVTNAAGEVSVTYTAGPGISTDTLRASASGGGSDVTETVDITVQTATVAANTLELLVSSPQLDSDNSEQVTLTALARDANNNAIPNVNVTFAASSGLIIPVSGTTDANGRATALLETAGDQTNRQITVTAVAGALDSEAIVAVTGTTVTLSGPSTLVLGQTTRLSILLRDAGGNPISGRVVTLSSAQGNTLASPTVTTGFNGQAEGQVTAAVPGDDTIQATVLGATGTLALTVSSANFVFTTPTPSPAPIPEVNLDAAQAIVVHWDEAGVNQVGATINFFATRGTLTDPNDATNTGSAIAVATDANGNATVNITSTNAGPASITAAADTPGGPSSQIDIEFVAVDAASLILQASPTSLGINQGDSADQQSIITAIVRDTNNNLVKNQTVSFSIFSDVSGGRISPPSAITDSFGRASTVYTAGAVPSAQDGVLIDAQVAGTTGCDPTAPIPTGPCNRVTLTVAQQALFMTLGTGNEIFETTPTNYEMPFKVIVTDANSNPIAGVRVELNLTPRQFAKGSYIRNPALPEPFDSWVPAISVVCMNEDLLTGEITKDRNGILDPGEDLNVNGELEPGNVATVPAFVTTGENGIAEFRIDYPQDHANWVEVELEARTPVAGSESSARTTFILPVLNTDVTNEDRTPPGFTSPFGVSPFCTDDL
jgi:hypothetical protein